MERSNRANGPPLSDYSSSTNEQGVNLPVLLINSIRPDLKALASLSYLDFLDLSSDLVPL